MVVVVVVVVVVAAAADHGDPGGVQHAARYA